MQLPTTHELGTAIGLGGEARQEFGNLISGCGIYLTEEAHIALTGADRVRWLNGMITNNVRDLLPGHGIYAFVLNPQGHILADLYAFHQGEELVVATAQQQLDTVLQLFKRYIIMDRVEVENWSDKYTVIGVVGGKAQEILARISWNKALEALEFGHLWWNGGEVTVVRGDNLSVPSYQLWVPRELADKMWRGLEEAGGQAIHPDTLEALRVACGIPKFGQDIRNRDLPQETGQQRALNFTKGCYIGQEIVERIRSRGAVHRTFIGFEVEGGRPSAGTKIQSEGKDVGEITSSASIPTAAGERIIAAGYLRKEFMDPGKELTAGTSRIKVRTFPFTEFLVP